MMTFFACSCLFDFVIVLKSKFTINDFIDLAEQNGVMRPNILLMLIDSTYYICFSCQKITISFLLKCLIKI